MSRRCCRIWRQSLSRSRSVPLVSLPFSPASSARTPAHIALLVSSSFHATDNRSHQGHSVTHTAFVIPFSGKMVSASCTGHPVHDAETMFSAHRHSRQQSRQFDAGFRTASCAQQQTHTGLALATDVAPLLRKSMLSMMDMVRMMKRELHMHSSKDVDNPSLAPPASLKPTTATACARS